MHSGQPLSHGQFFTKYAAFSSKSSAHSNNLSDKPTPFGQQSYMKMTHFEFGGSLENFIALDTSFLEQNAMELANSTQTLRTPKIAAKTFSLGILLSTSSGKEKKSDFVR
jgi:hypothetical protein